jgi:predicted MPP superfamily phosphohydrolase
MMMIKTDSVSKKRLSRRDFLKVLMVAGLAGLDTMLVVQSGNVYAKKIEPSWVEVTQVRLKLPRLPKSFSGFRMVQISDFHIGGWMNVARVTNLLGIVMKQAPDLVAITGDFVLAYDQGRNVPGKMDNMAPVLAEMVARVPVMAVLGNHDHLYNAEVVLSMLRRTGVTDLSNSVSSLYRGEDVLHIAGVDDVLEGKDRLDDVLAQLPAHGGAILLAHEPDFADSSSATGRFDLQISGHSHGGQVVLPFIGPPILPEMGQKYPQGLYRVGGMYQYTNRGVGMSPPGIRFNCRPEITVFTLESV